MSFTIESTGYQKTILSRRSCRSKQEVLQIIRGIERHQIPVRPALTLCSQDGQPLIGEALPKQLFQFSLLCHVNPPFMRIAIFRMQR
jgi:hypothetical protein